ncbi:MAG: DUF885 domain-containing protein [Acidobacteria bacterium]|nr:DUF885 domain-containing protein [Acidobacteriota bacterium]
MPKCVRLLALPAIFALILAPGCSKSPSEKLTQLSSDFAYGVLSASPSSATAAGLHIYRGMQLDNMLDDVSPAAFEKQRQFYAKCKSRLEEIDAAQLSPEDKADYAIIQNQIGLAQLDLNDVHPELHAPQMYVEILGNALFSPLMLDYAPRTDRLRQIIARLQKVPLFLDTAATNLASSPDVWTQVAIQENQGNINLVDREIRAQVTTDLHDAYARAARPALDAMNKFDRYLRENLSQRNGADWRLNNRYSTKFRLAMAAGVEADDVLQAAERQLVAVRTHMLQLALPLHAELFPSHKDHAALSTEDRINTVVGEVLDSIAKNHSTPESYMDDARKDLDEARAFARQKHLLTLPTASNLQVIPTPEFMRGIYAVGGFNPAPALEPQLGAFYWVTPIPADWPAERVESKLREYNFYKLKLLTVHEAMPGHYVQFEFANAVQPPIRRLLRAIFGNGPYIEGWAQYITQAMLDAGFLDHSPELALTFAKEELRVLANTILDIRLQMLGMSDQEALDLMTKQTFQEKEEATAKLQRAKLSSAQLPTYYVGWKAWTKLRDERRQKLGTAFNLQTFNDAALKEGAVPIAQLEGLMK